MSLGSFIFELKTAAFDNLKRNNEYRWASSEPIGNPPILQALGKGSERVDLEGIMYPFHTGFGEKVVSQMIFGNLIDELKQLAESQKPVLMVDGTGNIHGNWVIKQIDETQSYFDKFGNPKKIEFKLNLEKYSETNENLLDIIIGLFK
jgi:phage protein U